MLAAVTRRTMTTTFRIRRHSQRRGTTAESEEREGPSVGEVYVCVGWGG